MAPVKDADAAFPDKNNRIVYQGTGNGELLSVLPNGGGGRKHTSSGYDAHSAWSPDGTKIAFMRDDEIWVANADGSVVETRITNVRTQGKFATSPDWSPDSSRITLLARTKSAYPARF